MKFLIVPLFVCFSLSLVAQEVPEKSIGEMTIIVENIESNKGDILIGVFDDPAVFLERGKFLVGKVYPVENKGTMEFVIPDIPYGTYAIAVYHDLNSDTYLTKNLFGVPREAYGFYKDVRGKWAAPTFEETSFDFNSTSQTFTIEIKDWVDR